MNTSTQSAAALLHFTNWDGNVATFESWLERFELQIELLEINDDAKKAKSLLSVIGQDGYEMVRNLCTPAKPKDVSYSNLVKYLTDFVKPKPVVLVERYKFNKLSQNGEESVTEYMARVKRGAEHCDFGDFYQEAIRDKFIIGLQDSQTQKVLLTEENLTVDTALTKAVAREQAGLNRVTINPGGTDTEVNKLDFKRTKSMGGKSNGGEKFGNKSKQNSKFKSKNENSFKCVKCKLAKSKCSNSKCVTKCYKCQKVGHSSKTCFSNQCNNLLDSDESVMNYVDVKVARKVTDFVDVNVAHKATDHKPCIPLVVNNQNLVLELDTGSAITVISKGTFDMNYLNFPLETSSKVIRVANGTLVSEVMKTDVRVSYKGVRNSV